MEGALAKANGELVSLSEQSYASHLQMLKSVWKSLGRIIPSLCNDQPFLRTINLACACRLEGAQWKLVQVFPLHGLLHQDQKTLQLHHILALDAQVVSRFNESYGRLALPNHSSEKVAHIILDWILHTSLVR